MELLLNLLSYKDNDTQIKLNDNQETLIEITQSVQQNKLRVYIPSTQKWVDVLPQNDIILPGSLNPIH